MESSGEFGKIGEQKAVAHLISKGYDILHRNYRYLKAEIDIVARKGDVLAIVEVKSRSSEALELAAETVTKKKIQLLLQAADHYVLERDLDLEVRFDIITIVKNGDLFRLDHIENAFYHF